MAVICCFALGAMAASAMADCNATPGTVITKANWQQYKDCFSDGEQYFWTGAEFWKMPDDTEIHVGPPHHWNLPKPYLEATEKYGAQTRLVKQDDGQYKLENYTAGVPFPNPTGPFKGTEIAANVTYRMGSHIVAVSVAQGNNGFFYTKDRFGNYSSLYSDVVYRQLSYNWQPGVPQTDPGANGAWYTEWLMVQWPEQSKYTASLTILWQDNLRDDDDYAFVPSLRRSLRLSTSARCSPLLGSDMIKDDQRVGWNGGVGRFEGTMLPDRKILSLTYMDGKAAGTFPGEYDGMLGWPKPSWGNWEVRDAYVVDIHRIPSQAAGYCYGKRIDYIDKQYYDNLAEDIYDSNMKLWKVMMVAFSPTTYDTFGEQMGFCGIVEDYWDVQNDHVSYITGFGPKGKCSTYDNDIPPEYNNITRYSTPGGLMQLMR
jgi:Protein of unknown function (DUF1329)